MKRSLLLLAVLSLCAQALVAACVQTDGSPDGNGDSSSVARPTPWRTVTAPQAQSGGRSDCPAGWLAYDDPQHRFSVCYPADYTATAGDDAVNIDNPRTSGQTAGLIGLALGWDAMPGTAYYPPSAESCAQEVLVMNQTSSEALDLTISGRATPACLNRGALDTTPATSIGSLRGAVPLAGDGSEAEGYVRFDVSFTGVEQTPAVAQAIIEKLSIDFR
ncbi:MAG: hypothetical protein WEE64_14480 [Dehalococcoidia bacterium]